MSKLPYSCALPVPRQYEHSGIAVSLASQDHMGMVISIYRKEESGRPIGLTG